MTQALTAVARVGGAEVIATVTKHAAGGAVCAVADELAGEEPLEVRVRGRAVTVTMRTPSVGPDRAIHDAELAAGFLLSEGVIRDGSDVVAVEPCGRPGNTDGNIVNVFLRADCDFDPRRLTRHVFASSSCGLCGKATIDAVRAGFPPVSSALWVPADVVLDLPTRLREAQAAFSRTGGLHAAGLFDAAGRLRMAREDIGRHNAVDKVLGHALRAGWLPLSENILLVSGRVSFEIVQKALAGGVPVVAAVGAPSSLAVEFAHENNQTLIGFVRDGRMNVYTHAQRITAAQHTTD